MNHNAIPSGGMRGRKFNAEKPTDPSKDFSVIAIWGSGDGIFSPSKMPARWKAPSCFGFRAPERGYFSRKGRFTTLKTPSRYLASSRGISGPLRGLNSGLSFHAVPLTLGHRSYALHLAGLFPAGRDIIIPALRLEVRRLSFTLFMKR